jgi:hypothetical protein
VRVHSEHACLAAQTDLLVFSLCLKLAVHRDPRDTWQHRSPPQPEGEVQSHRIHDSAGAHLDREARSEAIGHVAVPKPTSARRRGPKP